MNEYRHRATRGRLLSRVAGLAPTVPVEPLVRHIVAAAAREGANARGILRVVEWTEAQRKPHIRLTMTS